MFNDLIERAITAVILVIVAAAVLWFGGWVLIIAVIGVAVLMDSEWHTIAPTQKLGWKISGIAYVLAPCIAALALRDLSLAALLFPIAVIVATDIGAFFAGKTIGGPKVCAAISPNKTWAGLLGGMGAAALVAIALQSQVPWPNGALSAVLVSIIITLLAQGGDFFESWLKRKAGVKDSGNVLPGHGGVLDRLDGYIFVLPSYLLYLVICAEISA